MLLRLHPSRGKRKRKKGTELVTSSCVLGFLKGVLVINSPKFMLAGLKCC